MPNKVLLKKSSVSSKVPLTTDLDYGELALNYADGKLYFKNSSNNIKSFTIDDSVVTLTGTQTLTNKTLTSPTINGGALSGTFSGAITLSDTTDSSSTTTGALKIGGGLGVAGKIYADQIRLTNNGAGTNVYIGDDVVLGDVNAANTLGIRGLQSAANAYIVFGNANNTNYIGRTGSSPLTVTGQFAVNSGTITGGDAVAMQISGYAQKGGTGYHDFLSVTNSFSSATNATKWFRLNSTGGLEIINNAYTSTILTLTDGGALSVPQISAGGSTGTNGQVLQSTGTGLQWASVGGTGTVTSITAGTGLSGGTITSSGTIALANTAVTAGSYTNASLTVDAQGRLTAASNGTAPVTSLTGGTGITITGTTTPTVALANTAVTAGSYTLASITVDAQGRITSASSGSGGGTVNTGTAGQLAFYASSTTAVSPLTALTWTSGTTTLALSGTFTATTLTETSDARLKTNVQPITNALSIVNALDGKTFIKDNKERIGLIAQQVQEILPQVVETADDDMKTLSVSYGSIVAVLIEAIKEQQTQIDELKSKLGY